MASGGLSTAVPRIRLYRELADWYSLLTPVSDYAEEAAFYRRLFEAHGDVNGAAKVIHDRHFMGLFPRTVWLELISAAGFEPLVVPFEHSSCSDTGHEVFLGLRSIADERDLT